MLDLLIRNGEVVTPQGVGRWTVGIVGEAIAYVGIDDPSMQAGRTIDAKGKIVVPGGIEPHAHLHIFDLTNPDSGRSTLGPEEDTRGMAFGGTTTHLDFCVRRGKALVHSRCKSCPGAGSFRPVTIDAAVEGNEAAEAFGAEGRMATR